MNFQKNDFITLTIEDIGIEGEGIGKVDGFTFFVKDAIPGDEILAKIMKLKKNYGYARLEKVITPSSFRVEPKCPIHRQCGGCQIQTMSYEQQLAFKQAKIKNNLCRIGGFDPNFIEKIMEPIIGMEEPFHYRNKAQYPIGMGKSGQPICGFYAGRTHCIVENTDCALGTEENKEILEIILQFMKEEGVSAYDEEKGTGLVRHVLIRKGFTSKQLMVCLVIQANKSKDGRYFPKQDRLIRRLSQIPGMTSISVSLNREKTNVIMGREIYTLWGEDTIWDTIHVRDMQKEGYPMTGTSLEFSISPLSFYQVNPIQTEKLYSQALEYAGLTGQETVWDLYCGIGTISLFVAGKAKKVYGVEIVDQAIRDARENAIRNHIENAEFFVGKAEEILPAYYRENIDGEMSHPDVIIVDPPRKGCDQACLDTMLLMAPEKIVYVSCDSATLARDVKILCDGGYQLEKVRGVDQFGQTVHVETVCLLSKLHEAKHHVNVTLEMDELDVTSAESKGDV